MQLLWSLKLSHRIETRNNDVWLTSAQHEGVNKPLPFVYKNLKLFDVAISLSVKWSPAKHH